MIKTIFIKNKAPCKYSSNFFGYFNWCFLILTTFLCQPAFAGKIPESIHQIWIGDSMPDYFNTIRERFIELNPKWKYNLWLTTEENIDSPYGTVKQIIHSPLGSKVIYHRFHDFFAREMPAIKKIRQLEINSQSQKNRKASISNLMRYRIITNKGGYYFDMKFELLKPLSGVVNKNASFVGANEDYTGFEKYRLYLSNAFFAATPNHSALQYMLSRVELSMKLIPLEFEDFGPSWFGTNLLKWMDNNRDKKAEIEILPTDWIYPYINWNDTPGARERGKGEDKCLASDSAKLSPTSEGTEIRQTTNSRGETIYFIFPCDQYPDSIAVDHFDFGSSWYRAD